MEIHIKVRQAVVCVQMSVHTTRNEYDDHLGWGRVVALAQISVKSVACTIVVLARNIGSVLVLSRIIPSNTLTRTFRLIKDEPWSV